MIKDYLAQSFLKCLIMCLQPDLVLQYLFTSGETMQFHLHTECCSFYRLKDKYSSESDMKYFLWILISCLNHICQKNCAYIQLRTHKTHFSFFYIFRYHNPWQTDSHWQLNLVGADFLHTQIQERRVYYDFRQTYYFVANKMC